MLKKFFDETILCMAISAVFLLFLVMPDFSFSQSRIKDIAKIKGLESRFLTGQGIVTGLRGTGDGTQAIMTPQAIANFMRNFNLTIDPTALRTRNVAFVTITAELPPFAKRGMSIDITVASLGDAQSLEGGILVTTPLTDELSGQVMVLASGSVTIGGLNVQGAGTQNFTASGRVVNGGFILQDIETSFFDENIVTLYLNFPDFSTAQKIVDTINENFGDDTAEAIDPASVEVKIVSRTGEQSSDLNQVEFISIMEQLSVDTDAPAIISINERTGTIVMGANVTLSPVVISHGDLTIQIAAPGAPPGQPPIQGSVIYLDEKTGATVADLVAALNALQVTPRDLISIFQTLKTNGSLRAILRFN